MTPKANDSQCLWERLSSRDLAAIWGNENAPASAFPVACRSEAEIPLQRGCGVSERTTINGINTLHFEDSLSRLGGTAGSFNLRVTYE
jgi:hypothetical protein